MTKQEIKLTIFTDNLIVYIGNPSDLFLWNNRYYSKMYMERKRK